MSDILVSLSIVALAAQAESVETDKETRIDTDHGVHSDKVVEGVKKLTKDQSQVCLLESAV